MKPIKIDIGQYEVYSSGTVVGNINDPIKFFIEDLVFEIIFKNNTEKPEQSLTKRQISPKSMAIDFTNFNNNLGSGNKVPIEVGFMGNKLLFLNFRVYSMTDDSGKMLHYTWLLKLKEGGKNA